MHDQRAVRGFDRAADRQEKSQALRADRARARPRGAVIGTPSTYSRSRNGMPASVTPPSISRAMLGCASARQHAALAPEQALLELANTGRGAAVSPPTSWRKSPPSRSPRNTAAMPPLPSSRTSRNATDARADQSVGRDQIVGQSRRETATCSPAGVSKKPEVSSSESSRRLERDALFGIGDMGFDPRGALSPRNFDRGVEQRAQPQQEVVAARRPFAAGGAFSVVTESLHDERTKAAGQRHRQRSDPYRNARAKRQSRLSVRVVTPSTSAICGSERPAK